MREEELRIACGLEGKPNVEKVKELLKRNDIHLNEGDEVIESGFSTPLIIACRNGYLEIVEVLMGDPRIKVNFSNLYGLSPFYAACSFGHLETVKFMLMDERVDINQAKASKNTFYEVCNSLNFEIAKWILASGREIPQEIIESTKSSLEKLKEENIKVSHFVNFLDNFLKDPTTTRKELRKELGLPEYLTTKEITLIFKEAVLQQKEETVSNLLLNEIFHLTTKNPVTRKTVIHDLIKNPNLRILKWILASGREIDLNIQNLNQAKDNENEIGITTLIQTFLEDPEKTRVYLRKELGLSVEFGPKEGTILFKEAFSLGAIKKLEILSSNPDLEISEIEKKNGVFFAACVANKLDIVKEYLKDHEVDVNYKGKDGETPFFIACSKGNIEIVKELLRHSRVHKNQANFFEESPFFIACKRNKINVVLELLNNSEIEIEKESSFEETPLFISCEGGHLEITQHLLKDKRIDVNKPNKNGNTPLMISWEKRRFQITQELLKCPDVNVNLVNKEKKCFLFIAQSSPEVLKPLFQNGSVNIRAKFQGKTIYDTKNKEVLSLLKAYDTEENRWKYIESCIKFSFLVIEDEFVSEDHINRLANSIKNEKNLRSIILRNTGLTATGALAIIQALLWNLEHSKKNLRFVEIDDIKLKSTNELQSIPIEIQNQGSKAIVNYILDLMQSPESKSLCRTKLMIVGFENVGKTSIIDCLFPLTGWMKTKGDVKKTSYYFRLQGKRLQKYKDEKTSVVHKEHILNNNWKIDDTQSLKIILKSTDPKLKDVKLYCEDEGIKQIWLERIKKSILNSATHGIDIKTHSLEHPSLIKFGQDSKLALTVWDFAGQHDYYNNHQYFLSTRSIFLVLWRMDQGDVGLEGLDFWLKSLSTHLPNSTDDTDKIFFSIIIVGTFLDHSSVNKSESLLRQNKVLEIAQQNQIKYKIGYMEVSCSTLENVDELNKLIIETALQHSYMGEKVTKDHLIIESAINELREKYEKLPLIDIQILLNYCRTQFNVEISFDFAQRALSLLHNWSSCIYFQKPQELSTKVILEPRFLTKDVLAQLFNPNLISSYCKGGILNHQDLKFIWKDFIDASPILIQLMEKFEVCFVLNKSFKSRALIQSEKKESVDLKKSSQGESQEQLLEINDNEGEEEDYEPDFWKRRCIIPSLLPENEPSTLMRYWKDELDEDEIEIERVISYNLILKEMIGRLITRLHLFIHKGMVWRTGLLIIKKDVLALIRVDLMANMLSIIIRGSDLISCQELMDILIEIIEIVAENYQNMIWKQMVRSNHDINGLVSIESCQLEMRKSEEERDLICPITKLPLNPESLLTRAGFRVRSRTMSDQNWLNEGIDDRWELVQGVAPYHDPFVKLTIIEDGIVKHEQEFQQLQMILKFFGGDATKIRMAHAIHNSKLSKFFETERQRIDFLHKNFPQRHKKTDWKELERKEKREFVIQQLYNRISSFKTGGWNDWERALILPIINGNKNKSTWKICSGGFGKKGKTDQGFFGKGFYFTTSFQYASRYAKFSKKANGKVFVIAVALVGNSYPAIEAPQFTDGLNALFTVQKNHTLYGRYCKQGYQSHFALVDKQHHFPFPGEVDLDNAFDEIVVFEKSQTLPLYLITLND